MRGLFYDDIFFLIFFIKTYVAGTHLNVEAIQMSNHNI